MEFYSALVHRNCYVFCVKWETLHCNWQFSILWMLFRSVLKHWTAESKQFLNEKIWTSTFFNLKILCQQEPRRIYKHLDKNCSYNFVVKLHYCWRYKDNSRRWIIKIISTTFNLYLYHYNNYKINVHKKSMLKCTGIENLDVVFLNEFILTLWVLL